MEKNSLPPITSFTAIEKIGKKRKKQNKDYIDELLGDDQIQQKAKRDKLIETADEEKVIENPVNIIPAIDQIDQVDRK